VIWLYYRFALSIRDVEELPFERGIVVTYEIIHASVQKFGARFAASEYRSTLRSRFESWREVAGVRPIMA